MSDPEFLICISCEAPCYEFDSNNGKITTILCTSCGNEDPADFMTESEFEEGGD